MRIAEDKRPNVWLEVPGEAVFFIESPWPYDISNIIFDSYDPVDLWSSDCHDFLPTKREIFNYRKLPVEQTGPLAMWFDFRTKPPHIYGLADDVYVAADHLCRVLRAIAADHDYRVPPHWKTLVPEYWRLVP